MKQHRIGQYRVERLWALVLVGLLVTAPTLAQESEAEVASEAPQDGEEAGEAPPDDAVQAEAEPDADPRPPRIVEALRRYAIATERANNDDCGAAIAEFEAVYEILQVEDERYSVLFNMAVCYEELLRFDEALGAYGRFLEEAPSEGDDPVRARRAIRRIEAMLATLVIKSNVPAEIWVDDEHVDDAPATIRVTAGRHSVELRAAGHEASQQEITVASGVSETLQFQLSEISDFDGISPAWVWAAGASALAIGVGAAVAGGIALSRSNVDEPITDADVDRVRTPALTADIMLGVAGALAITTIVLATVADWDGDEGGVDVAIGAGSVQVRGSF